MQKKRPRGKGGSATSDGAESPADATGLPSREDPTPRGRPVRVRRRLVVAVAVVAAVVAGAGAPGILAASADLTESQRLVDLASLDRQAVTLAHSLSDERDEVVAYLASRAAAPQEDGSAGQDEEDGEEAAPRSLSGPLAARVDRQIDEIRAELGDDHPDLRRDLASVPSLRRTALGGKSTPMDAHRAYTSVVDGLQALADDLAERTPPRAADATRAPAALGRAVEQASAARGLLVAALAVPQPPAQTVFDPFTGLPVESEAEETGEAARTRDALSAAAQQARVRELAALADFDQAAAPRVRDKVAATVSGAEVKSAEGYLARLTDQPTLSAKERATDAAALQAALTARIEQMRGAETTLASDRIAAFEQLRDDDVTALELRVALAAGLLLAAVGVLAAVSRTLTRPLAVLRLGAARLADEPESGEPVRFTGRNDEFAQVVRSLNTLHGRLRDLGTRVGRLDSDHSDLVGSREALSGELAAARAELGERTEELTAEVERLRHTVHHSFVNLSLRSLGLVERQLAVIEKLEDREQDPERLATLFTIDHMATVMRRHSENLLVLAGAEHGQGHVGPVPLVDVLRAAVSEIERYDRVVIRSLPPHAQVAGFAADDLSHLVAELLENATAFSPPEAQVEMEGWLLEGGEVMLSVQDAGIGMTAERIAEVNALLADPAQQPPAGRDAEGLGLRVAGLLAARHGVRVQLREHKQGGITAVVVVPEGLLPQAPPAQPAPGAGEGQALSLPGSVAEANSNVLPAAHRRLPAPPAEVATGPDEEDGGSAGSERPEDATAAPAVPLGAGAQALPEDPARPGRAHGPGADPLGEEPPRDDPFVAAAERAIGDAGARGEVETHERTPDGDGPVAGAGVDQETFAMRLPPQPPEPGLPADGGRPAPGAARHPEDVPATAAPGPTPDTPDGADPAPTPPGPGPATATDAGTAPEDPHQEAPGDWDRVTEKGLPKRTPKIVAQSSGPAERTGAVDAEALRRRLGGFQRGARDGRRDAETEITGAPEAAPAGAAGASPAPRGREAGETGTEAGDTVEEARR
ncbi:nitrate- and nitrite sensing domain-containing protein [Streptomyces sp. C10-9-1]|uniref:sensor histidine kinase n=1 Tax=Streptomyces sp. C10-9-1 TaxID=1859285 RepID=UPI0021121034|nr:nitrate- and nitrite sensing domain-containing protein [Streptomyces sp. C10-9-1]MCQ6552834.1 nitrate- and nitrite sensing domain-containing protein [Streptomyces sp. C10-9-1]